MSPQTSGATITSPGPCKRVSAGALAIMKNMYGKESLWDMGIKIRWESIQQHRKALAPAISAPETILENENFMEP